MVRGLEEFKRSLGADVRHNRQERRMGQKSKRTGRKNLVKGNNNVASLVHVLFGELTAKCQIFCVPEKCEALRMSF